MRNDTNLLKIAARQESLRQKKMRNIYDELQFLINLTEFARKHYPDEVDYTEIFRKVERILNK